MLKIIDKISKKHDKANKLLLEFKKIDKTLENTDLVCTKTDGTPYNFNNFSLPLKFIEKFIIMFYSRWSSKQSNKIKYIINKLNNDYNPRNLNRIDEKQKVLNSARKLQNTREDIIDLCEKAIFPFRGNVFKKKEESEENKFFEHIENKTKDIDHDLFRNILILKHLLSWQKNYLK